MTIELPAPAPTATVYDCGGCGKPIHCDRSGFWWHFSTLTPCPGLTVIPVTLTLRRWP